MHVFINGTRRCIDTEKQRATALFELALEGKTTEKIHRKDGRLSGGFLEIRNLRGLFQVLENAEAYAPLVLRTQDLSGCPSFCSEAPLYLEGVISWDETHYIKRAEAGSGQAFLYCKRGE
jgi:hypothetical protein